MAVRALTKGLGTAWRRVRHHSVAKNSVALGLMQIANYVAPLVVLPYLARVLGVDGFGLVMVALAASQFAYTLTDYGFSLSATRDISLHRDDAVYINRKVGAVWLAKLPLVAIAVGGLVALPYLVPNYARYHWLFAAAVLAVVCQAYQPIWLFLGVERMKNVTTYMVATKAIYVLLVVLLVRTPAATALVVLCWGTAQLMGLVASVALMQRLGVRPKWPGWRGAWSELRSSAQFFWSRLAVALYTSANTVVLGAAGAVQAAHYAACDQAYAAGKSVTAPLNTAMFPYMVKHRDWRTFYVTFGCALCVLALGCAIVAIWSGDLLALVFGESFRGSAPLLRLFAMLTVINYVAVAFGYPAFAALGRLAVPNLSVVCGAVVQGMILVGLYLTHDVTALTMGYAVVVTEAFVMLFRVGFFIRFQKVGQAGQAAWQ